MATIIRELNLKADLEMVWSQVRDVGAVATKLAPGFVVESWMEDGVRHVTFASGLKIEELIVSIDDVVKRVVYSVLGRAKHHQASMQIIREGPHESRFIWITDVVPDEAASRFEGMMDQALPVIKRTLESNAQHT